MVDPTNMDLDLLERTRVHLNAKTQELPVIPPGRFCDDPGFLDALPMPIVKSIFDIEELRDPPGRAALYSLYCEEALIASIRKTHQRQENLQRAIAMGAMSLKHLLRDDPRNEQGKIISVFGRTLRQNWQHTKESMDLDDAIYLFRKAIEYGTADDPFRPFHFHDLGCVLRERYNRSHDDADFEEGRKAFVDAAAHDHSAEPIFLKDLGRLLKDKALSVSNGDCVVVDESIEVHKLAISRVTDQFKGSVSELHFHLALAYMARYSISRDVADWKKANPAFDEAISWSFPPNRDWLVATLQKARAYRERFVLMGLVADADRAIELFRSLLDQVPDDCVVLSDLGDVLRRRFQRTGVKDNLTEAFPLLELSAVTSAEDDPDLPVRLARCSDALADRFKLEGRLVDIDVAIELSRTALSFPTSNPWDYHCCLGTFLLDRFNANQADQDLEDAVVTIQIAMTSSPNNEGMASCQWLRGTVLMKQYDCSKQEHYMTEAIESYEAALGYYCIVGAVSWMQVTNDLANALMKKFERTGSSEDLARSIRCYHDAIRSLLERRPSGSEVGPDEAMLLHSLGNSLLSLFLRWRSASYLDKAVLCYRRALDATDEFNLKRATRAGSLSWALLARYEISEHSKDIEEARTLIEDVFKLPIAQQLSAKDIAWLENRLGCAYLQSYRHRRVPGTLEEAIKHLRAASADKFTEYIYSYCPHMNLALALEYKAKITQSDADFAAAASQYIPALSLLQNDDPDTRTFLRNAASFMIDMYHAKRDRNYGEMALKAYNHLRNDFSLFPEMRIIAAMQAAHLYSEMDQDFQAARDSLSSAVLLLPEAILTSLNRGDQLHIVRRVSWLPRNLTAISLAAGDPPSHTLQLFESSRSIIWDRLMNQKTSITELQERHPELASAFENLIERLGRPVTQGVLKGPISDTITTQLRQHELAIEYSKLIGLIRQQDGFEDFLLLPSDTHKLQEYASLGPVVVINITEYRKDAIIITRDEIIDVELSIDLEDCFTQAGQLFAAICLMQRDPEQASTMFDGVLQWIWHNIAEPILKVLGFIGSRQQESLPRLWWLMTGVVNLLPMHAAGDHKRSLETGEPCTVLDRVISSYTPTLKALDFARQTAAVTSTSDIIRTALLVQMPITPDNSDLTHAQEEISAIEAILASAGLDISTLNCPKRNEAVPKLQSCTIAHFACHATADKEDPSKSQLQLSDWKSAPMDVRTLSKLDLKHCQLAYLSACETASNKDPKLLEEGIHISGGFQMAGVPHVIATCWEAEDSCSVSMATDFYNGLMVDAGSKKIDFGRAAESLHSAVRKMRNEQVDALLWGAYIHCGP